MNVFGEKKRSWRKGRKRGVSPIIATILLVAITVVLAAVLYVLISGLTTGPGNAPLGSHFGWGSPTNQSGITGCASAKFCYQIDIASVSSVSMSEITLGLHSATGASIALPSGGTTAITLNSTQGALLATYNPTTNSWTASGTFNGALSAGMSIRISGSGTGLLGDSLVAIGSGSYSGTVVSSAFP